MKFQVTLNAKMTMSDLQRFPGNLFLIKNVEETVVFLTRNVFISVSFSFSFASYKQVGRE